MRKKLYLASSVLLLLFGMFIIADSQSLKPVFFKLKDIRDVSNTAATDGQFLKYVSATGLWTPSTATGTGDMLEADWATGGVIKVAKGGTGLSTVAANSYLKGNDASALVPRTYSEVRTDLGLVIGTNVQAYDADLTTYAGITPSANIQSLLGSTDYATARTNLGLAIGTNVQAYDADLTTYAGITPSANAQTVLGETFAQMKTSLTVANAADTTNGTTITGASSDTITLTHDGTNATLATTDGVFIFDSAEAAAVAGIELSDDDTNYVTLQSVEMASDYTISLPAAVAGGANYVLNTTGANGILQFSDPTSIVAASSTTVAGKVEIAIASEVNTGTSATLAISPDALAGSALGTKTVILKVMAEDTAVATGDGKMYFTIPVELTGMDLVSVGAHIYTASSSGTPTFQIHNLTDTHDMLSTRIVLDENETDSATAAAAAVIDAGEDDVVTADVIRIDVDVAGTGAKGLEIRLGFRLP